MLNEYKGEEMSAQEAKKLCAPAYQIYKDNTRAERESKLVVDGVCTRIYLITELTHVEGSTEALLAVDPILNLLLNFWLLRVDQSESSDIGPAVLEFFQVNAVQVLRKRT